MSDEREKVDRLSILSNLSNLSIPKRRHLYATYSDDIHTTLRLIAYQQGLTIGQVVSNIIIDYVQKESQELFKNTINIQNVRIEQNVTISQFIIQEEILTLCKSIRNSIERNAPKPHLMDLRDKLFKTLHHSPTIPQDLVEEIKITLQLLREH